MIKSALQESIKNAKKPETKNAQLTTPKSPNATAKNYHGTMCD